MGTVLRDINQQTKGDDNDFQNTRRQEERTVKYHGYHVVEASGDAKARWIRIEVAFAYDDGDDETLVPESLILRG